MAETPTTAIATTQTQTLPAPTFGAQMQLARLSDALEFADIVCKSGLAPKGLNKEGVVIAMQMGYEVGLSPLQAIQNIASINGRPAIWGDAQLALVRASGLLESIREEAIGEPGTDGRGYRVTVKRAGQPEASDEFTVADAKRAALWGKAGPWTQYPQRMLRFRARGFILRDQFGDVLKGLRSAEEVMDEPPEKDVTALGTDAPASPSAAERLRAKRKADPKAEPAPTTPPAPEAPAEPAPEAKPPAKPYELASAVAAIDATGTPRGLVVRYLQAAGKLAADEGLDKLDQDMIAAIVERPLDLAHAVSKWEAEQAKG